MSITWDTFSVRHFGTFLLVLQFLDVVILTERIQILYIVHLLLILMTNYFRFYSVEFSAD
jgi:hypothetical protein